MGEGELKERNYGGKQEGSRKKKKVIGRGDYSREIECSLETGRGGAIVAFHDTQPVWKRAEFLVPQVPGERHCRKRSDSKAEEKENKVNSRKKPWR